MQKRSTLTYPIGTWDVSRVTNMQVMFSGAEAFNVDISKWDMSQVADMTYTFFGVTSFDQTLCGKAWVHSKATQTAMFDGSPGSICGFCSTGIISFLPSHPNSNQPSHIIWYHTRTKPGLVVLGYVMSMYARVYSAYSSPPPSRLRSPSPSCLRLPTCTALEDIGFTTAGVL